MMKHNPHISMPLNEYFVDAGSIGTIDVAKYSAKTISKIAADMNRTGQSGIALDILRAGIRIHREDSYLWRDLGYCYQRLDLHDKARVSFATAARIEPDENRNWMAYARALAKCRNIKKAEVVYMKLLPESSDREKGRVFYGLGKAYKHARLYDLAAVCFDYARRHTPDHPSLETQAAHVETLGGRFTPDSEREFLNRLEHTLLPARHYRSTRGAEPSPTPARA